MELAILRRHGGSIRDLVRMTGWSRNTVRRRLQAAAPDRIPAVVLFREIRSRGYCGGETRLKEFVRGMSPVPAALPVVPSVLINPTAVHKESLPA